MLPAKGSHFKTQTFLCPTPQSRLVLVTCGLETSTLIVRDLSPPTLLQHTMREQCVVEPEATIETNPYSGNTMGAQRTAQSVVISQTKLVGSYKGLLVLPSSGSNSHVHCPPQPVALPSRRIFLGHHPLSPNLQQALKSKPTQVSGYCF